MEPIINQLRAMAAQMQQHLPLLPDNLTSFGHPNLNKLDLPAAIEGIVAVLESLKKINFADDQIAMLKTAISANVAQLQASIGAIPQNPQAYTGNFLSQISALYGSIMNFVFLPNNRPKKDSLFDALRELIESAGKQINIDSLREDVITIRGSAQEQLDILKKSQEDIKKTSEELQTQSAFITTAEKDIATKHTSFQKTYDSFTTIATAIAEKQTLVNTLETKLNTLITESEKQTATISAILEDSNRAGMAGSFNQRKKELGTPQILWGIAFVGSLIGLSCLSAFFITQVIDDQTKAIDWTKFLLRLPVSFPFIWIAWFSGSQYKYALNLREEYAFKNASAMAYEGYKREAKAVDTALLQKLLETSIANMSENPLKAVNAQNLSETPLSSAISSLTKLLEKISPEAIKKLT